LEELDMSGNALLPAVLAKRMDSMEAWAKRVEKGKMLNGKVTEVQEMKRDLERLTAAFKDDSKAVGEFQAEFREKMKFFRSSEQKKFDTVVDSIKNGDLKLRSVSNGLETVSKELDSLKKNSPGMDDLVGVKKLIAELAKRVADLEKK